MVRVKTSGLNGDGTPRGCCPLSPNLAFDSRPLAATSRY